MYHVLSVLCLQAVSVCLSASVCWEFRIRLRGLGQQRREDWRLL